jgi:oligosaccharide repeat unit polymerase
MLNPSKRLLLLVGTVCYMLLLHWAYTAFISPSFSYLGYIYLPPSLWFMILIGGFAVLPSLWLPIKRERPSQFIYWLLYVLVYIPAMVIPWYSLNIQTQSLLLFDVVLLLSFACLGLIYKIPVVNLPKIKIPPMLFWLGFILMTLTFHFYIFYLFGFRFQLISFADVYDIRAQTSGLLSQHGAIAHYIVAWTANVVNPVIMAIGLTKRRFRIVSIGMIGQVLLYSLTGNKTALLSGVFVFFVWLSQRKKGRYFGLYTVWGLAGIVIICCLVDLLVNNQWATSLFVRRMIITPGLLTGFYIHFFSEHPKAHLAHSIFEGILPYPYPLQPANLIGSVYWGNPSTSANANIWADAYANFGLWGVFGFTILLGILLWSFDSLAFGKNPIVTTLLLSMPSFALVDAALLTTLLHHGLGFAILIIYFLPEEKRDKCLQQEHQYKRGGWLSEEKNSPP